jgi:acetylornithine deacetylase/succinyl-diaminopimelate desuccinylase-like protein
MRAAPTDPVALARALIGCPSVTPEDHGALGVVQQVLEQLGFTCHRLRFEEDGTAPVENLYARLGAGSPNLCFAGHTTWCRRGISTAGGSIRSQAWWRTECFAGGARST